MQLRLPFWRYPVVILFSLLMHGILVLILIKQPQQSNQPFEIRWFEFKELELTKPVPRKLPVLSIKPIKNIPDYPEKLNQSGQESLPKNKTFQTEVTHPKESADLILETKEKPIKKSFMEAEPSEVNQTYNSWEPGFSQPPQTGMQPGLPHISIDNTDFGPKHDTIPENVTGPSISFDEVLEDTRRFQNQILWNDKKSQIYVSSSLGDLLTGIKMISINKDTAKTETNLRLDSEEAQSYLNELNTFFSEHWEVPLHLAESELTVVARIRIDKDGWIQKSDIEKPSGNSELDHSVQKLLKSLQSLPSLPYSYVGHSYEFGIRFTPRDFQF